MSKEKTNSLLNCPFCGGELEVHCTGRYYMHKLNGCIFQHYCFETDDVESIEKWNTRKPLERIVERIVERIEDEILERLSDGGDDWFEAELINEAIEIVKEEGGFNY